MILINFFRAICYFFKAVFCCGKKEEEFDLEFYIKERKEDPLVREMRLLNNERYTLHYRKKSNLFDRVDIVIATF